MRKTFLISVATAALIAGTSLASAQGMNKGGDAPAATAPSAGAPSSGAPAEKSAPMNRSEGSGQKAPGAGMKGGQAEQKMQRDNDSAQRDQDKMKKGAESDSKPGSKAASDTRDGKSKSDMKADSKNGKSGADRDAAETKSGDKKAGSTTGQAGSGAKMTSEQRTKVTTVIRKQNVKPVTNVNFSISVGTVVPRSVAFHPVPVELVTIYPDWRGYQFFLVRDEIVIVNPRTLAIVAVIPA